MLFFVSCVVFHAQKGYSPELGVKGVWLLKLGRHLFLVFHNFFLNFSFFNRKIMMGGGGGDALSTLPRSNVSTKCDGGYKHSMKLCCVAFYLQHSSNERYAMELPGVLCRSSMRPRLRDHISTPVSSV